jgi:subtilase family serine protease
MHRLLFVVTVALLAGCAGATSGQSGGAPPLATAAQASRAPSDAGTVTPAESPTGLPGESPTGLPGGQFACAGVPATGIAACTVTININVSPNANPSLPRSLIPGLHPGELRDAYGYPNSGAGGTVAIVDAFDDPAAEADLAVYRAAFGMPACTTQNGCFSKVNQAGQALPVPAADPGWAAEIALDLDMVSAGCPGCKIILVEANSASIDDLGAAVDTAVALGAQVVSNSYYAVEWPGETAEDVHFKHPGVAITVSSGDRGYATYPAASKHVTAVGGTSLSGTRGSWTQTPWKYAGHGCSAYEPKPAYQSVASCSTRAAVDIAAVGDPQTGVATFASAGGGWLVAGGTSVGAPLVAAGYALSGRFVGPSYAYAHASSFTPVGGGGPYHAKTGLGTPSGLGGL